MRNIHLLLFIPFWLMASSCLKKEESITPIAKPVTLAELQREAMMQQVYHSAGNTELSKDSIIELEENNADPTLFYLNIKYSIADLNLTDNIKLDNSYEILSNSLLRALAQLFIRIKGGQDIELDAFQVPFPEQNLDLNIIRSIKIKKVRFELNKHNGADTNFAFIQKLNLKKPDSDNQSFLYTKNSSCKYKCIDFKTQDNDFYQEISSGDPLFLQPELRINSLPKNLKFRLDGTIELKVGLLLPF